MKRFWAALGWSLFAALGCSGAEKASESNSVLSETPNPWDSQGKADGVEPSAQAPGWLLSPLDAGTWGKENEPIVRGWVDARVLSRRFEKRVFVELLAPYEGGAVMRTLHPAWFKEKLDGGYERWGIDTAEIYPTGGPGGARLSGPVLYRLRLQEDPDGDGRDQMVVTPWQRLYGEGPQQVPELDLWTPGKSYPAAPLARASLPKVYFPPFDDAGDAVAREIEAVTLAKLAQPLERHSIYAAVFNINDPRLTDRLIAAHQAGVEVRLLTEASKLRPTSPWQTEDDRLLAAGVPLLGIHRRGNGAMHVKFALFDGKKVATGSFNWEVGSSKENHENMLVSDEPALVQAYAQRFAALAGEVQTAHQEALDPAGRLSVSFAPDEKPYRIAGQLIDQAQRSLYIAMFTAKNVYYQEDGQGTSLFDKLIAAVHRGVAVTLITDFGIAEASEYFGVLSPDDPCDEWLEERGVHVVRADNPFGQYASMHHKFTVVDGTVLLTGAFNWYYDAAFLNDEDQLVWRDAQLAANYTGEFADLLRRYDPAYRALDWPQVTVHFQVHAAQTRPGDTVYLVGDLPELGQWDPSKGLALDPGSWPQWKGAVKLTAGVRLQYKYVTRHSDGSFSWQGGDNHQLRVPTGKAEAQEASEYEVGGL